MVLVDSRSLLYLAEIDRKVQTDHLGKVSRFVTFELIEPFGKSIGFGQLQTLLIQSLVRRTRTPMEDWREKVLRRTGRLHPLGFDLFYATSKSLLLLFLVVLVEGRILSFLEVHISSLIVRILYHDRTKVARPHLHLTQLPRPQALQFALHPSPSAEMHYLPAVPSGTPGYPSLPVPPRPLPPPRGSLQLRQD